MRPPVACIPCTPGLPQSSPEYVLRCVTAVVSSTTSSISSHLHVPHEPQCLEDADEVPGGVQLPPLQAVARRVGELQD